MVKTTVGQRIISGLAMLGLCLWYIFSAPENIFILITFFLAAIGIFEFHQALLKQKVGLSFVGLMMNNALFYMAIKLLLNSSRAVGVPLLVVIPIMALAFSLKTGKGKAVKEHFAWYLLSVVWISAPLCLLILIRFIPEYNMGAQLLLWIVLVVAGNDTFAYFGGKRFGKNLLAPNISPKKTIEGSLFGILGGVIGSFLTCWILEYLRTVMGTDTAQPWIGSILATSQLIWMPFVIVPLAQVGDLVESKFKRFCGIKDSSHIIPGHGGLLDRSDAYLLALPCFFALIYFTGAAI